MMACITAFSKSRGLRVARHCGKTSGMQGLPPTRRQFVASSVASPSAAGLASAQDEQPKIINAGGPVSLPRFLSAWEFLAILDANGAESAIVGTAATCPDLHELSRAAVQYGDRLRSDRKSTRLNSSHLV